LTQITETYMIYFLGPNICQHFDFLPTKHLVFNLFMCRFCVFVCI